MEIQDLRREIYGQFSRDIVSKREGEIRLAINAALGNDQWLLIDLAGRVRREICAGVETYILDDKPIIEIHPPTFDWSEDGMKLTANWKVRQLTAAIGKQKG
jgi:hypothetical protein